MPIPSEYRIGEVLDALDLAARHPRVAVFADLRQILRQLLGIHRLLAFHRHVQFEHLEALRFFLKRQQHLP